MPDHRPTIERVEMLCRERSLRLTAQRREAFNVLRASKNPLTAYELLALLEAQQGRKLAPLTVYRALDFWVEQGFVHKIASSHSYAICDHPEDECHASMHLVCTACGAGQELSLPDIDKALAHVASRHNFTTQQHIVELQGLCGQCA